PDSRHRNKQTFLHPLDRLYYSTILEIWKHSARRQQNLTALHTMRTCSPLWEPSRGFGSCARSWPRTRMAWWWGRFKATSALRPLPSHTTWKSSRTKISSRFAGKALSSVTPPTRRPCRNCSDSCMPSAAPATKPLSRPGSRRYANRIKEKVIMELKNAVRQKYGEAALRASTGGRSCCGAASGVAGCADPITSNLYNSGQASQIPREAVLASLGC